MKSRNETTIIVERYHKSPPTGRQHNLPMALQRFQEAILTVDSPTFFYTHDYEITNIPDDVKHLKTIAQVVHIGNCFQLRTISNAIGDLSMLRWLNLSYNGLTELPSSIGRLRHLERLHVNNNQLKSLPIEIWGLKSLEELRIDSNQLTTVPTAVVLFPKLREFFSENNKFVSPSDVEGVDLLDAPASLSIRIPHAGDCSNCNGRFGKGPATSVSFHSVCGSAPIPAQHICCSAECQAQLAARLEELERKK